MKYISLDLETTGTDPSTDQILQISMVFEDSSKPEVPVEELPYFTAFIKHERIKGSAFALAMNGWILDIISGRNKETPKYPILVGKNRYDLEDSGYADTWIAPALDFITAHFGKENASIAGKNVGTFDLQFLPKVLKDKIKYRVLDVGPLFMDFKDDKWIPDLKTCKTRSGLDTPVAHDAREDALDVIRLVRARIHKDSL